MKKTMRKAMGILLTAMMVMSLFVVSASASDYQITVNGAIKDATYTAYKVFDANYDGNKVNYTVAKDATILNATATVGEDEVAFSEIFDATGTGDLKYITVKDSVQDDAVFAWLDAYFTGESNPTITNTEGATSVTLDVGSAGYYFIRSSVGSKNAIEVTTAKPVAAVDSKIESTPTVPDNGKQIVTAAGDVDVTTLDKGAYVQFKLTFNATNYATENGEAKAITEYKIVDAPTGFTIVNDDDHPIAIKVNNEDYTIGGGDITLTNNTFSFPWDQTTYASPSTVVITYYAQLTGEPASDASNKATFQYVTNGTPVDIPDEPEVHVYNYTVNVNKVDADNTETNLPGAVFVLTKTVDSKTMYYVNNSGVVGWVESIDNATKLNTAKDNGEYQAIAFEGLAAGTYSLVEIEAPDGYNLAPAEEVVLNEISQKDVNVASLTVPVTVEDSTGTALPSTGGMGTTLFYAVGGILVVAAVVFLVSKKRAGGID